MTATELEADNAKLREQVERLRTQLADMTESVDRVEERCAKTFEVGKRWMAKAARFEAENTKLRELAKRMARALGVGSNLCDRNCGWEFECDMVSCPIEEAMRDLGVEVD